MYLDAHTHLEREYYGDELPDVIARAHAAGVDTLIAVGASGVTAGAREAIALAEAHPRIFATAGIHPHEAQHATSEAIAAIAAHLDHPKVVALGEVGLDFHYDNSPRPDQRRVFARFLEIAIERNVPIMLHIRTRTAHEETWNLIDRVGLPERGGVVHCFSDGPDEAREYLERGFYLSIPGIVTFNKSTALQEAVRAAPIDRLFVETDAPYLAPVPYRGKRNEAAYVVATAAKVGELKGVSAEQAGRLTRANAVRFFALPDDAA